MKDRTRLIVDMSSILWTCLLVGSDTEFGKEVMFAPEGSGKEPKPVVVNSAEYGYENVVNHFEALLDRLKLAPMDMVLVVEGLHSKVLRQNILPQYKAGRDRPDESYEQFQRLRDMVVNAYTGLGAIAVTQDGIEADDVIGYLCRHLKGRKIVDSNDGDLYVLISDGSTGTEGVAIWKQSKGELFDGTKGPLESNPYGPFPCKFVPLFKAIVGDTGDKIPGAKGFGAKTWLDFLCNYDEEAMAEFVRLIETKKLDELAEDVGDFKPLQKVIDNKDMVYKSYQCARLYDNLVNTQRKPLQWTAGMVRSRDSFDDKRLKPWAQQIRLVHAANYGQAVAWMKEHVMSSPFLSFDIETSSNDTADQWLETAKTKSSESKDAEAIDVFGAELCSFSLTFGRNMQYTFFFTVDHVETDTVKNITKEQAKAVLQMCADSGKITAIQNKAFELPVIMNDLGPLQQDVGAA